MSNSSRRARRAEARRRMKQMVQEGSLEQFGASWRAAAPIFGESVEPDGIEGVPQGGSLGRLAKTADIAGMLAVHPKTVERWRRRDGLPCLRIRGAARYDVAAVLQWAAQSKWEPRK